MTLTSLETEDELTSYSASFTLTDRFDELRIVFFLEDCVFQEDGDYLLTLDVDDDEVAHRRIYVQYTET